MLVDLLALVGKHSIDFTYMPLHLCGHPLAFFGEQLLNFLPVSIIDIYRQKSNQVEEKSNQVEDHNTGLRHSDTDLDTGFGHSDADLDTGLRHSDADLHTKRVILTNKEKDIVNFCSVPRTTKEILDRIGVSMHSKNRERYITSLVAAGYLQMTNPDNPTASNQKYKKVNK